MGSSPTPGSGETAEDVIKLLYMDRMEATLFVVGVTAHRVHTVANVIVHL